MLKEHLTSLVDTSGRTKQPYEGPILAGLNKQSYIKLTVLKKRQINHINILFQ